MANKVTVSGMFGSGHTYFADSPVVIEINGLEWPTDQETGKPTSPFNVVHLAVKNKNHETVGNFREDTGGQEQASFDISSALRAIWSDISFDSEVETAQSARSEDSGQEYERAMRKYSLNIHTEYISSDDGGVMTTTQCVDADGNEDIPGGQCLIGGMTEWERSLIGSEENKDVSHFEHTGVRNGDASTKPISTPETVGRDSITSWVDVKGGYTKSIFYPPTADPVYDDTPGSSSGWTGHAPLVLRDKAQKYADFLFVNRRGAVETCSALMQESMNIEVETKIYSRVGEPSFLPTNSMTAISSGGRRSWQMSSGYLTREWAEWWTMEFLKARQWWMLYAYKDGGETKEKYVPVVVTPAKKSIDIYSKSKQQMPSVEFTVSLALEG